MLDHVHVRARVQEADQDGRPRGCREDEPGEGEDPLRRHRQLRRVLQQPRHEGVQVADERAVHPRRRRGAREEVPEGGGRRGYGVPQGTPLRGRRARVHLQRHAQGGSAGARRLHG